MRVMSLENVSYSTFVRETSAFNSLAVIRAYLLRCADAGTRRRPGIEVPVAERDCSKHLVGVEDDCSVNIIHGHGVNLSSFHNVLVR
jgi:hypothetical protein